MNQPPGSALPLDSFLFPPGSYVLDGRYQVECLIGQNRETGSHVYRAVAVDAVPDLKLAAGDRVVVKVMPSADTGMARAEYGFLRQAVDNWRDASVAQPVEVSSDGGSAYIVTRYVAGDSLREVLDKEVPHGLAADRAIELVLNVLDGLTALHRVPRDRTNHGIIHRDIKPQNVIVADPGTPHEKAVIIDLGIASTATKVISAPAMGTRAYASPEQMSDARRVATQSDIFSTTVMLYEMLCGKRPYPENFFEQLIARQAEPQVHGLTGPRGCEYEVERINALLQKGLMLNPAERFESAAAMASQLKDIPRLGPGVVLDVGDVFLSLAPDWDADAPPQTPLPAPGPDPEPEPTVPTQAQVQTAAQAPAQTEVQVPAPTTAQPLATSSGRTTVLPPTQAPAQAPVRTPAPTAALPPATSSGRTTVLPSSPTSRPGPFPLPGPSQYRPDPGPDEYSALIDRSVGGRRPADWQPAINEAVAEMSRQTAVGVYQDNPVCRALCRLRGGDWLDDQVAASVSAVPAFRVTDDDMSGLRNYGTPQELRERMRAHDAAVREQARADAARVASWVTTWVGGTLFAVVLFIVFWMMS